MEGKSYFCDYCECYMKNDVNIRKGHMIGTSHKKAKENYMQKFKEPQQILLEESTKIPCKRILNNLECMFGFYCRFSHYSAEELAYLKWLVDRNQTAKSNTTTERLPWKNSKNRLHSMQSTPSLQQIDFEKIDESCFSSQWG